MKKSICIVQKLLFATIILIIAILLVNFNLLEISDELWNFQNIFKMSNCLLIYKDANVIITPIFFYIGNILFKILGATIITFRIYNILICTFLLFIIFKILKNLKTATHISLLFTSLIFLQIFSVITTGANYNVLAIAFALLGMNLYINKKSSSLLQGFVTFLVFFTKQNIGVYYIIATIIYELYLYKISKEFFIHQITKFLFFLIPTSILILKLYFDGILFDFINYAFGGLFEFGEKNLSFSASITLVSIFCISILLYIFVIIKRKSLFKEIITNEVFDNLTLLIIFSILVSFVIYPIANSAHFILAVPFHLIFIFYLLNVLIINDFWGESKYFANTTWITIIIFSLVAIRIFFHYAENINKCSYINNSNSPFYKTLVYDEFIEKQSIMCNYIREKNAQGIDVIILSHDSAITMVELNQSHGVYDLLFNGNLGYNGKEKIKNDIISRDNTEFLVVTEESDIFKQEATEIRDYVIKNLNYRGDICNYSVYGK